MSITINVKSSSGGKYSLDVQSLSETVGAFKVRLAAVSDIPAEAQRLIFRGHVLKDNQTLQDIRDKHGLETGQTMHVVRGTTTAQRNAATQTAQQSQTSQPPSSAQPTAPSTASPFGMFGMPPTQGLGMGDMAEMQRQLMQNPEQMQAMMNSPMMESLLNNPELARNMMMATPQMRELIERNPEVGHVFNDPSTFRQMMQIARNPSLMNEMMRNTDRQMANIEMMPGGFDALRRMQENFQAPLMDAVQGMNNPTTDANDNNAASDNPFASLFQNTPSNTPMPNPWAPNNGVPTAQPAANPSANNSAERQAPGTDPAQTNAGANPSANNPFASLMAGMGGTGGAPQFPGMPQPAQMDQMLQMMENPMMQQMLQSMVNDPAMLETMINSSPQLQAITQANPEMAAMLRNPGVMQALINPDVMRSLSVLRNAMGGGQAGNPTTGTGTTGAAPMGGAQTPGTGGTAPAAGTAPRGVDMNGILAMMNAMGGLGRQGTAAAPQPEMTQEQLEQMYSSQLAQLRDMGFLDTNMCLQALRRAGGNVAVAVENLLNQLGG